MGPLHAWSSAVQGKPGPLTLPTMVRVLCGWLADRLESGGRLQKPEPLLEGAAPLSFFTDAKAEAGRAWIGGFLELVDGCQGPWFSLEVVDKGDPGKVIAAVELLAPWLVSASGYQMVTLRRLHVSLSGATQTTSPTSPC